jgi:hypothetical protein
MSKKKVFQGEEDTKAQRLIWETSSNWVSLDLKMEVVVKNANGEVVRK